MLKWKTSTIPVYVLCRSSGGYLAQYVYHTYDFVKKAAYLCPILIPYMRCHMKPLFRKRTHKFFDVSPVIYSEFDHLCETIHLATNDQNLPNECLSTKQLKYAMVTNISNHKDMLTTTDPVILNNLYQV